MSLGVATPTGAALGARVAGALAAGFDIAIFGGAAAAGSGVGGAPHGLAAGALTAGVALEVIVTAGPAPPPMLDGALPTALGVGAVGC
jgi:hypothetical protein